MRKLLLLSIVLLGTVFYNSNIWGKTTGENKEQIKWKDVNPDENIRSLLPISGYIENHSLTIYLYESPETTLISIYDISENIVYESIYTDMSQETIDLSTLESGAYEIVVEYNGKGFVGDSVL